jgi:hypothetical protein
MMAAFLDELGIANDNGRIDSETTEVGPQDAAKVKQAADVVAARFPADEVGHLLPDAPAAGRGGVGRPRGVAAGSRLAGSRRGSSGAG